MFQNKHLKKNNNNLQSISMLPPELWWKIGLYANEILTVRSLRKDIYDLHPERVLVANRWSWTIHVTKNDYENVGDYLLDLQCDLEDAISPSCYKSSRRLKYSRTRLTTQTHVFRKIFSDQYSFGDTYMEKLNNLMNIMNLDDEYTDERRVHEVYKLRGPIVKLLNKKSRNVLSLIY
jgi:hypothetical protein